MTTQTTTIDSKNLNFIPSDSKRYWKGKQEVVVLSDKDSILIKKTAKPELSLSEVRERLNSVGKQISKKDIEDAIKWARNSKQ